MESKLKITNDTYNDIIVSVKGTIHRLMIQDVSVISRTNWIFQFVPVRLYKSHTSKRHN